jgi:hypothetical protein
VYLRTIIINKLSTMLCRTWVLLLLSSGAAASVVHEYTIRVDPRLDTMHVAARFEIPIHEVRARSGSAGRFLDDAKNCDTDEALGHRGQWLTLPRSGVTCIDYVVDLKRAATAERRNASLAKDNIVISPAVWLWRPPLDPNTRIIIHFDLADGIDVSVPWQPLGERDGSYEIPPSPHSARAVAAFGRFVNARRELQDGELSIALLRPKGAIDAVAIVEWVYDTASNVSLAYGRFPNPSPQVVVLPIGRSGWQSDSPVPFGRVLRDGGEAIELFVNERRPIEDFYDDWTATHEFSHLMLPFVRPGHRWISEGFAQYYQNVLLTRAGQYDEQRAWQKLHDGFQRGRRSRPELSPNEAAQQGVGAATMKIYWSGAIIALMADVELRRRSGGRESLDSVLDRLQGCCLPSARSWSGTELFGKLDGFVEEPVFMPLYRKYADASGFPRFEDTLERLGVTVSDGTVRLNNDAEFAGIRKSITEPDSEPPREGL